jgi:hypothetical protein
VAPKNEIPFCPAIKFVAPKPPRLAEVIVEVALVPGMAVRAVGLRSREKSPSERVTKTRWVMLPLVTLTIMV